MFLFSVFWKTRVWSQCGNVCDESEPWISLARGLQTWSTRAAALLVFLLSCSAHFWLPGSSVYSQTEVEHTWSKWSAVSRAGMLGIQQGCSLCSSSWTPLSLTSVRVSVGAYMCYSMTPRGSSQKAGSAQAGTSKNKDDWSVNVFGNTVNRQSMSEAAKADCRLNI